MSECLRTCLMMQKVDWDPYICPESHGKVMIFFKTQMEPPIGSVGPNRSHSAPEAMGVVEITV